MRARSGARPERAAGRRRGASSEMKPRPLGLHSSAGEAECLDGQEHGQNTRGASLPIENHLPWQVFSFVSEDSLGCRWIDEPSATNLLQKFAASTHGLYTRITAGLGKQESFRDSDNIGAAGAGQRDRRRNIPDRSGRAPAATLIG